MVSNSVKQWREQRDGGKGISKAHLAREIEVCQSYITKLEQGKLQPSSEVMFRIAQYFKCAVEDVFHYQKDGDVNSQAQLAPKHD